MATTVDITTNYVGQVAGDYIALMIKEANTLSENLVTVMPNVVSTTFLRKIDTEDDFVDYTCGFTPGGGIVLSEKPITPKKIKSDKEICKEDFRQLWTAQEMGFSAHNDKLPATEQAAILLDMGKKLASKVDKEIWNGDGTTGKLLGLIPQMVLDADVIDVATPVVITTANVEAQVEKFIGTVPDQIISSEGLVLGVSTNVARAIRAKQGSYARSNGVFTNPSEFQFNGYVLTEIKGLDANTMVAYQKANVFFLTGLVGDLNEIRVKDMDESDLSGMIRTKIVLTGATGYAYGAEIVLYKTA